MVSDLLLLFGLIVANGLFSATEIAVIALRSTRVSQLVEEKRGGALAVQALRNQPERFLATVQVGITAVSAAAAMYGEHSIGQTAAQWLAGVPGLAGWAAPLAFALTIAVITYLSVVLGELVPKSLALRKPELFALALGRPLGFLARCARPVVWLLTASSNLILRFFGDKTSFTEARLSPDELQELVAQAAQMGQLDNDTADIASRALTLRELTAEDVMRPRTQITALPLQASRNQIVEVLERELPDRLPLYEGTIDNLIGYVAVKELSKQCLQGRPLSLRKLLRPVQFIPPTLPAMRLFTQMQKEHAPLAVVLDEGGGTKGLVAFEDLLAELVGEVSDDSVPPPAAIRAEADGALVVRADTPVRELNREHGLDLPESEEWSTLAGLCLELAGRIPAPGTMLSAENGRLLEVLDADVRAVRLVRVHPMEPAAS